MAGEVKWIKIVTNIFDDEKILMIETMPSADSILVVWFKLLCLAGKTNNSGVFMFNERIPYTDEMLAAIFRRDINTVRLALKTFEDFGMIEIVDNVITIPNWGKHQSLDAYEKKKIRDRERVAAKRAEQRALIAQSPDVSRDMSPDLSPDVASLEEDKEKEIDKDIDKERENMDAERPTLPASVPYDSVKNLYNKICTSFPRCTVLSDARKKAIKARFVGGYTLDDFKTLFAKAEASGFLKGQNDRNWTANIDWLIKDANMAKVLDGNYDDKPKGNTGGRKEIVPVWMQDDRPRANVEDKWAAKEAAWNAQQCGAVKTAGDDP